MEGYYFVVPSAIYVIQFYFIYFLSLLQGDISYGSEEQFENEALMAVRTANFISAFLQVVDPKEIFPGKNTYQYEH